MGTVTQRVKQNQPFKGAVPPNNYSNPIVVSEAIGRGTTPKKVPPSYIHTYGMVYEHAWLQ